MDVNYHSKQSTLAIKISFKAVAGLQNTRTAAAVSDERVLTALKQPSLEHVLLRERVVSAVGLLRFAPPHHNNRQFPFLFLMTPELFRDLSMSEEMGTLSPDTLDPASAVNVLLFNPNTPANRGQLQK